MQLTPMLIRVNYKLSASLFHQQAAIDSIDLLQPLPFDDKGYYYTPMPIHTIYRGKNVSTIQIGFQTKDTPPSITVAMDCPQQPFTSLIYNETYEIWLEQAHIQFHPEGREAVCQLTATDYITPFLRNNNTGHLKKFAPIVCQPALLTRPFHETMAIHLLHMYRATIDDDRLFNKNLLQAINSYAEKDNIPSEQAKKNLHYIKQYVATLTNKHRFHNQCVNVQVAKAAFRSILSRTKKLDMKQSQQFFNQIHQAREKHARYLANALTKEATKERPPVTDETRDVELSLQLHFPVTNWAFYRTERDFIRVCITPSYAKGLQQTDITLQAFAYTYTREQFNMYDYNTQRSDTMIANNDELKKPFHLSFTELPLAQYEQLFSAFATTKPGTITIKGKAKVVQPHADSKQPFLRTNEPAYSFTFTQLSTILLNGQVIQTTEQPLRHLFLLPIVSTYTIDGESYTEQDVFEKLYDYRANQQLIRLEKREKSIEAQYDYMCATSAQLDSLLAKKNGAQSTSHFARYAKLAQLESYYDNLLQPQHAYTTYAAWCYFMMLKQLQRLGWQLLDVAHYNKLLVHVVEQTTILPMHITLQKAHFTLRLVYTPPEWKDMYDHSADYTMTITNHQNDEQKVVHLARTVQPMEAAYTQAEEQLTERLEQLYNANKHDITFLLTLDERATDFQLFHHTDTTAHTAGIIPFSPANVESFALFIRMLMEYHFDSTTICWHCGHEQRVSHFVLTKQQQAIYHLKCPKCLHHTMKSYCRNGHPLFQHVNSYHPVHNASIICPACSS